MPLGSISVRLDPFICVSHSEVSDGDTPLRFQAVNMVMLEVH